jgi:hypothetical protein
MMKKTFMQCRTMAHCLLPVPSHIEGRVRSSKSEARTQPGSRHVSGNRLRSYRRVGRVINVRRGWVGETSGFCGIRTLP